MKSKKICMAVLGVLLPAAVLGLPWIGSKALPTVNHAVRISELLQPVLRAQNQTMHIRAEANVNSETVTLETDVYLVTGEDTRFLALEQRGITLYIADNLLLLENGRAFRLSENMQMQTASYGDLLPRIGALYDALKITAEETEDGTVYSVTVPEDQIAALLAAVTTGESLPVAGIRELRLHLTEKEGKLEQILFSGSGGLEGTSIRLNVTLSGFRILASGDYPIPEAVKQSAATVDPDTCFSLTEDLYRLVAALVPLADMESLDGTLALTVDCGLIQLDTERELSDLKTSSAGQIDPEQLQTLPETLGWLCMNADIRCTRTGNAYVYALELDRQAMRQLSGMILPELAQYGGSLTEGNAEIVLEEGAVSSMKVTIGGKIGAGILQIPVSAGAEFVFG